MCECLDENGRAHHAFAPATIAAHSASSITFMPNSAAFLSFDPAPGPATTKSVLAETDPAASAPNCSACALVSSLLMVSSLPVKTTVLPRSEEHTSDIQSLMR